MSGYRLQTKWDYKKTVPALKQNFIKNYYGIEVNFHAFGQVGYREGALDSVVVEALSYKPEGRGFKAR
jgi:hypothetical protein